MILFAAVLLATRTVAANSADEHAYLAEIALGTETGTGARAARKWTSDLAMEVHGRPTDADMRTLSTITHDLNQLVSPLELRIASECSNVNIHFVPETHFPTILREYRPPNRGFHWVRWNEHGEIYEATILISTELSQSERSHVIREELTQSLGFLMDSPRYPDSIFYSGWTTVDEFSELDKKVIRLLYSPEIEPGSTPSWVRDGN